jgi:hypothetical protein
MSHLGRAKRTSVRRAIITHVGAARPFRSPARFGSRKLLVYARRAALYLLCASPLDANGLSAIPDLEHRDNVAQGAALRAASFDSPEDATAGKAIAARRGKVLRAIRLSRISHRKSRRSVFAAITRGERVVSSCIEKAGHRRAGRIVKRDAISAAIVRAGCRAAAVTPNHAIVSPAAAGDVGQEAPANSPSPLLYRLGARWQKRTLTIEIVEYRRCTCSWGLGDDCVGPEPNQGRMDGCHVFGRFAFGDLVDQKTKKLHATHDRARSSSTSRAGVAISGHARGRVPLGCI